MDFGKGEETVAVAAIIDKCRLQRGFDPRYLGKIDISPELFSLLGFEIKFLDTVPTYHHNPGFFRVGGIDQHFVAGH